MSNIKKDKNGLTEKEFLDSYQITDYERPSVTVDNLLFVIDEIESDNIRKLKEKRLQVLLVKRDEHPFIDKWSLPGTFVRLNETLEEASIRCLEVKARLENVYLEQLYTFGDITRDPRTRVLSVSYMGLVDKKSTIIKDTSNNTCWFTVKKDETGIVLDNEDGIVIQNKDLAFDHGKIISYGLTRMKNKLEYTDIAFSMLSEKFTLAELQQVYEVILNKKLTKANFQRKIKDKVTELPEYKTGGFRPAKLYKYNSQEQKGNN